MQPIQIRYQNRTPHNADADLFLPISAMSLIALDIYDKRVSISNHVILPLSSLAKYRASDHVCMITFYSALTYLSIVLIWIKYKFLTAAFAGHT